MTSYQDLGERLRRAREQAGFTQAEAGVELGVSAAAISHYESGKRSINALALDRLASLYGISVLLLLERDSAPSAWETALRARTRTLSTAGKRGVSRLIQTIHDFEYLQEVVGSGLAPKPHSPFAPLGSRHVNDAECAAWAEKTRRHFDIGTSPLVNLNDFLEAHGYHVFTESLGAGEDDLSSFIFIHPELGPVVAVNGDKAYTRRPFTMAHEFAHALFHYDRPVILCRSASHEPIERFADQFAAHLLVPEEPLAEQLYASEGVARSPAQVVRLARYFGVSYRALLQRLKRTQRLQPDVDWEIQPVRLAVQLGYDVSRFELGDRPLPLAERFPGAFLDLALRAAHNELISPRRIAEMLGISFLELDELLDPAQTPAEERDEAYA
jgi:Zn-dependent peptidase ImmA (M78 family)/transcriptional regulator with XRE-family HTH domain